MPAPSNLIAELANVNEYWSPRVIGQINDQFLKVAKALGELVWHKHDDEDELFYVVKGRLVIEFENDKVTLDEGDFYIVPRGVLHHPVADEECWIALVEKATTQHTGDIESEQTKTIEQLLT